MLNHPVRVAAQRAGVSETLIVQRNKGWAKVTEEGRCRMCERPSSVRPLTRHHVVPLRWFRAHPRFGPLRHADPNIVPLCEKCHRDVERLGDHARVELRRLLGSAEVAFVLQLAGADWLDERYPTVRRDSPEIAAVRERRRARQERERRVHSRDCSGDSCVASCPVEAGRGPLVYESRRRSESRRSV
jgi:ferredoxin